MVNFTNEQKELLALLPKALKNSQELTDSAKLVLSNIIFLYGMEDAQKNGYVYRSYDDLMKDTFIKSKTSISKAIALLVQKEYIKVRSGRLKDRKANEFTLLDVTLLNDRCTDKCTDKCTDRCTEKCTDKCTLAVYLTNKIESLENEVVLLKKEIEELKKCTDKNDKCTEKCTTESDTDIESDKDKEYFNTTGNSTNSIQVTTGKKNKKKKSIKKEKENEMNDNGMNGMNALTNEVKRNEVTTSKQECISTCFGFFNELEEVTTGNTTSTEDIENMRIVQTNETNHINSSNEEVDAASNQTIKTSLKSNIEESETELVQHSVTNGNTDFNKCKLKTSINSKSITVSGSNSVAEETNNSITSTQTQINNNFNADSKKDSLTSTQKQVNEGSIFSENCPKSLTPPNCATPPLSLTKEELAKRLYILHEVGAKEMDIHKLQNVCTEIKHVLDQLKTMDRKMYLRAVQDTSCWSRNNNFNSDYELISVVSNLKLEIEKQQNAA